MRERLRGERLGGFLIDLVCEDGFSGIVEWFKVVGMGYNYLLLLEKEFVLL